MSSDVVALLLDGAADAEDAAPDAPGSEPSRAGALAVERPEAGEVEAVIAEMHAPMPPATSVLRCSKPVAVQVTVQRAEASLPASSQSGDVQMSLACAEQVQGMPRIRLA